MVSKNTTNLYPVLRNRNYLLRFRFRLLTSYGWSRLRIYTIKSSFKKILIKKSCLFTVNRSSILPRNLLNEGNQIHNFILCLWELMWFHFSTVRFRQKVKVPVCTVPVPLHCLYRHNTAVITSEIVTAPGISHFSKEIRYTILYSACENFITVRFR